MNFEAVARKGYEAYGDFVDWRNFAGLMLPQWHELPEKERNAWITASCAIAAELVRRSGE